VVLIVIILRKRDFSGRPRVGFVIFLIKIYIVANKCFILIGKSIINLIEPNENDASKNKARTFTLRTPVS
jgi:hypothetical protein